MYTLVQSATIDPKRGTDLAGERDAGRLPQGGFVEGLTCCCVNCSWTELPI